MHKIEFFGITKMEKHGNIILTSHDIAEYNAGKLSKRASSLGLSFSQVKELVETKTYSRESDLDEESDFLNRQGSLF